MNETKRELAETQRRLLNSEQLLFSALGRSGAPHTAELTERLYDKFGGPDGFANAVYDHFLQTEAGSMTRSRVLEMVVRLTQENTKAGGAKKPLELMTEEELQAECDQLVRRAAMQWIEENSGTIPQNRIVDALPIAEPAAGDASGEAAAS